MKILVCIKQVPDSDFELVIDPSAGGIGFAGRPAFKMNRYDEYAAETALQIRQTVAQTTVAAVSVGPAEAAEVLKRTLGMGADHGILIQPATAEGPRPLTVAAAIAGLVAREGYDLVIAGALSEDEMNGTTGSMIAAKLGWPCATHVVTTNPKAGGSAVCVEREVDGGERELLEIPLPAVLTVQTGASRPRYPSLSMMLRANRYRLDQYDIETLAPETACERTVQIDHPAGLRSGVFLSGTTESKADELVQIFRTRGLLP
jgi:electron transfer flavoprotein beta subunit